MLAILLYYVANGRFIIYSRTNLKKPAKTLCASASVYKPRDGALVRSRQMVIFKIFFFGSPKVLRYVFRDI